MFRMIWFDEKFGTTFILSLLLAGVFNYSRHAETKKVVPIVGGETAAVGFGKRRRKIVPNSASDHPPAAISIGPR